MTTPKLELAHEYRNPSHSPLLRLHHPYPPPPPLAMDMSSVRFRPVLVEAQAEMLSTFGHPRLNWPKMAKVNTWAIIGYLGIIIASGKPFSCNLPKTQRERNSFGRLTQFMKKVGNKDNVTLLTYFLATQCTPILFYGVEAAGAYRYELKTICHTYDRAFMKIFSRYLWPNNYNFCQWYSYSLDFGQPWLRYIRLNKHVVWKNWHRVTPTVYFITLNALVMNSP